MPTISYDVTAQLLTRARACIRFEQPNLAGASDAAVNAVARDRIKYLALNWIHETERRAAASVAAAAISTPSESDMT